jgi:hypothetical protein
MTHAQKRDKRRAHLVSGTCGGAAPDRDPICTATRDDLFKRGAHPGRGTEVHAHARARSQTTMTACNRVSRTCIGECTAVACSRTAVRDVAGRMDWDRAVARPPPTGDWLRGLPSIAALTGEDTKQNAGAGDGKRVPSSDTMSSRQVTRAGTSGRRTANSGVTENPVKRRGVRDNALSARSGGCFRRHGLSVEAGSIKARAPRT